MNGSCGGKPIRPSNRFVAAALEAVGTVLHLPDCQRGADLFEIRFWNPTPSGVRPASENPSLTCQFSFKGRVFLRREKRREQSDGQERRSCVVHHALGQNAI
jgi:hypothetical protein